MRASSPIKWLYTPLGACIATTEKKLREIQVLEDARSYAHSCDVVQEIRVHQIG